MAARAADASGATAPSTLDRVARAEAMAPLPAVLHVEVADPLGDWAVEVHRHAGTLDLLFSGDADLARALDGAEADLRRALAGEGATLGLLHFTARSDRQEGRDAAPAAEPSPRADDRRRASADPASETPPPRPRRGGLFVNRLA